MKKFGFASVLFTAMLAAGCGNETINWEAAQAANNWPQYPAPMVTTTASQPAKPAIPPPIPRRPPVEKAPIPAPMPEPQPIAVTPPAPQPPSCNPSAGNCPPTQPAPRPPVEPAPTPAPAPTDECPADPPAPVAGNPCCEMQPGGASPVWGTWQENPAVGLECLPS